MGVKFKQRSSRLVNVANFKGAKIADLDDKKRTFGPVEKLLNTTKGSVTLLLDTSRNNINYMKGGS